MKKFVRMYAILQNAHKTVFVMKESADQNLKPARSSLRERNSRPRPAPTLGQPSRSVPSLTILWNPNPSSAESSGVAGGWISQWSAMPAETNKSFTTSMDPAKRCQRIFVTWTKNVKVGFVWRMTLASLKSAHQLVAFCLVMMKGLMIVQIISSKTSTPNFVDGLEIRSGETSPLHAKLALLKEC